MWQVMQLQMHGLTFLSCLEWDRF